MMRHIRMLQARRAFTLIEVIAALAIIGLGLVGILSLFPVGIDASKRAGDLTNATILGQSVLDQIRSAANRGELALTDAKSLFPESFKDFDATSARVIGLMDDRQPFIPKVQTASGEHTLYQYQVKFGPPTEGKLDDLDRVGLQKVTLTVSWPANEPQAAFRNRITLVTFIKFPETR